MTIRTITAIPFIILIVLGTSVTSAKEPYGSSYSRGPSSRKMQVRSDDSPYYETAAHCVGNIHLFVGNDGTAFGSLYMGRVIDPITGTSVVSMRYPASKSHRYLSIGGLWCGAVTGHDTLVSTTTDFEFAPDPYPAGAFEYRTTNPENRYYSPLAKSEQDFVCTYTDTFINTMFWDPYENRPHAPLGLEITQTSYAWSYGHADDFILFDCSVRNIGNEFLKDVYLGYYYGGYVKSPPRFTGEEPDTFVFDDLCGFLKTYTFHDECEREDTVNVAYVIDNDGDPSETFQFTNRSPLGAGGFRLLRAHGRELDCNFNWWASDWLNERNDFGPRRVGTEDNPFYNMGVLGTPRYDRAKYHLLSNREFDYDQVLAYLDHTQDGWLPRPSNGFDIADGNSAEMLIGFGPFDMMPGEVVFIGYALVFGDNVHQDPEDFVNYFNPGSPYAFMERLDFSELAQNARWAARSYDNPGVDTDGDGYRGKFYDCCLDSIQLPDGSFRCRVSKKIYYEGDGIPDIRAASPPLPPTLRVTTEVDDFNRGAIVIRWNGFRSETMPDPITGIPDFEGYRIYISLSPDRDEFNLLDSYDRENYAVFFWDSSYGEWIATGPPVTIDSLKIIFGEDFDPLAHDRDNPLFVEGDGDRDSLLAFITQDWNSSALNDTGGIHRIYPDQPYPSTLDIDTTMLYYPGELTDSGEFKYFEYEYKIRNLLPSQLYYVSVTAFDYGAPGFNLGSLESNPTVNMVGLYPQLSARVVEEETHPIVVYPNPYRIDGNYRALGFEGRGQEEMHEDRVRALHFANLPHKCTIRIFSIDGDLIRKIRHDYPPGHPLASHDSWDLITRNTQAPVSGIYYYSVDSEFGVQVGKFVIIK